MSHLTLSSFCRPVEEELLLDLLSNHYQSTQDTSKEQLRPHPLSSKEALRDETGSS